MPPHERLDLFADLRRLVGRPHVLELLDALSSGPMTIREMQSALPAARREIATALRDLVVVRLVTRAKPGSWDDMGSADTRYRHTELGRVAVRMLSRFSVWTSFYDGEP